ncbi:SRPBCC family protein [Phytoactinopolyspora limicola]|uniref:SRPBCC family protein n=1 Tax=Phytoactinopolyspora limicola TaxID=2715536 RepID=UPI00140E3863|nr:SRPBCC family protein [Phytoactinopolyspora limicola]
MTAHPELSVSTPSPTDIVLTRQFRARRELVFAALTTPELLVRWFGARGWNLVECTVDLRLGGAWRFVSRGPDGEHMAQSGVYRHIDEPSVLSYTEVFDHQSYPGHALVTHVLTEQTGTTTLSSTIRYPSPEARERVLRYPMARGVSDSYLRLDAVLADSGH